MLNNVVESDGCYLNQNVYYELVERLMNAMKSCVEVDWNLIEVTERILVLYKYSDF